MGARWLVFGAVLLAVLMITTVGSQAARSSGPTSALASRSAHAAIAAASSHGRSHASGIPEALVASLGLPATDASDPTVGPMVEANGSLGAFNAEVESAADPANGYLYNLWIANDGIGFARSTDGGASFDAARIVPGSEVFFDPANPNAYAYSWDPAIVVSSTGIVYAAFMYANWSSNPAGSPYVAVSFDHGASFAYTNPVLVPKKHTFSDREFIAVAPDGTVYVTWNYAPKAQRITFLCSPTGSCSYATGDFNLLITVSHDEGKTWSTPTVVTPNYPRGGSLEGPIVVGANGEVFVQFDAFPTAKNYSLSPGQEWFTSSTDGGATWSTPFLLSGPYTVQMAVWWIEGTIAISSSGTLYAAWDVQTDQGDIGFVRYSTDNGVTWSDMIRVTPDVDNAAHIMQVAPGDNGIAYVGWLTNNSAGGAWGVYIASLDTSTNTVSAPVTVSSMLGDPAWWPGDTLGMAYLGGGKVSVSWGAQVAPFPLWDNDGIFNVIVTYP